MHRIDTGTAVEELPTPKAAGTPGFFKQHDFGIPGTVLDRDFLNHLQEEIATVILNSGSVLDKADNTQLYTAIQAIIASGPVSGLYLPADLDVLTYSLTNVTGSNFAINLPGTITCNAAHINISNNLIVGSGSAINEFISEGDFASNSATAITDMQSVAAYINARLGSAAYYTVVRGYTTDTIAASTTRYVSIGNVQSATSSLGVYSLVMPSTGVITALQVLFVVGSSGSTPGTVTFTLQKNETDTSITGTVSGASGSYNNTSGAYASVVDGDRIALKVDVSSDAQKYPAGLTFKFLFYPLAAPP